MNVRELITELSGYGAHEDIREFTVVAYDAKDERRRKVTGISMSPQKHAILIHVDVL